MKFWWVSTREARERVVYLESQLDETTRLVRELRAEVRDAVDARKTAERATEQLFEENRETVRELNKTIRKMAEANARGNEDSVSLARMRAKLLEDVDEEDERPEAPVELRNRFDEIYGDGFVPPPFRTAQEQE